jgi:GTP cyclohydrolase I
MAVTAPSPAATASRPGAAADRSIDLDAAAHAIEDLLVALGQDPRSADLTDTPQRAAAALAELLRPAPFALTTFANDGGYDEMVVVRDIAFSSLCAHHLLPIVGVAHVAYLPGERIVGLSKIARLVERVSSTLQTPERLTNGIAAELVAVLDPRGVGVVVEAEHRCTATLRERTNDARIITTALAGAIRDDPATRSEFLALTRRRG